MTPRDRISLILSAVLIVLGVVMTIQTITNEEGDGLKLGYILGPALFLAGLGRGWLAWHMMQRRRDG